MAKTRINGRAELEAMIGKDLPASDWLTLSFDDIVKFADATGDHQWIHVDRERIAKESPFGKPVAHGYYTLSRIGGLFFETVEITGFPMAVNYGLNKVRFPNPLTEGSRYRLKPEVLSVTEIPNGVEGVFKITIEIEGAPKPACVAECVFRLFGG